jgi:ssDNA-binding Zn-finger/Zn-ribbon topoisomerase 1
MPQAEMTAEQVILEVRTRYRICNRFFTAGACIWALGMLAHALTQRSLWLGIAYAGLAIFFVGVGLTVAIYRCPVCNKYLSRFRPDKRKCPNCGAQVRDESGRP